MKKERTECEVYSRCVGYLRPIKQWNPGKRQEFKDRKTFDMKDKKVLPYKRVDRISGGRNRR